MQDPFTDISDDNDQDGDEEPVDILTCTASLVWTPDPEAISCKMGCNTVSEFKWIYLKKAKQDEFLTRDHDKKYDKHNTENLCWISRKLPYFL